MMDFMVHLLFWLPSKNPEIVTPNMLVGRLSQWPMNIKTHCRHSRSSKLSSLWILVPEFRTYHGVSSIQATYGVGPTPELIHFFYHEFRPISPISSTTFKSRQNNTSKNISNTLETNLNLHMKHLHNYQNLQKEPFLNTLRMVAPMMGGLVQCIGFAPWRGLKQLFVYSDHCGFPAVGGDLQRLREPCFFVTWTLMMGPAIHFWNQVYLQIKHFEYFLIASIFPICGDIAWTPANLRHALPVNVGPNAIKQLEINLTTLRHNIAQTRINNNQRIDQKTIGILKQHGERKQHIFKSSQ